MILALKLTLSGNVATLTHLNCFYERVTMATDPNEVDVLENCFEAVLGAMDVRFTTHQFLLRLAHDHQREYVAGLAAFAAGGMPFKALHHAVFKRLKKLEGKTITLRKESYPSQDIFGTPSHSGLWKKL